MRPSEIIYIAQPYSHPDPWVRQERYDQSIRASAALLRKGMTVYSPIMHSHPVNWVWRDFGDAHEFWMRNHLPFLRVCRKMIVLKLDGWEQSRGVAEEIEQAAAYGIPIEYATMQDIQEM